MKTTNRMYSSTIEAKKPDNMSGDVQRHSVHTLVFRSLKRTHDMFLSDQGNPPPFHEASQQLRKSIKVRDEYGIVQHLVKEKEKQREAVIPATGEDLSTRDWQATTHPDTTVTGTHPYPSVAGTALNDTNAAQGFPVGVDNSMALARLDGVISGQEPKRSGIPSSKTNTTIVSVGDQKMLVPKKAPTMPKPVWHAPWKLYRVISGHLGWVRCIAMEPGNEWFVTGSGDRVIKIWDLASGQLKLSLTGHISTVRGVVVSPRQPYLFSCGEDKQVKCWDLEYNKVIRHYHGHLSAVYALDLHPTIDVLASCGRDATVRIWDMRTMACVHTLTGHINTVADVKCQGAEPQIISGSHDCTIRLWDLAAGRSRVTLTNHKKSVRSVALHPTQYTMASASPDNIKQWMFPDGNFIQNLTGHNSIVNTLALNQDSVLVSGGDNGTMYFWDWKTGYNFQRIQAQAQPGSIDSEAGIFASTFDKSGSRLLTCEADKTIKIYKEDENASEETHPVNWRPDIVKRRRY